MFKKTLVRIKALWHWLSQPIRYLQRYYEPWILSSNYLLLFAGMLYGYWYYAYQYEKHYILIAIKFGIPAILIFMAALIFAVTLYHFWRPQVPVLLTRSLNLRKLYQPWMLSVISLMAIGGMVFSFWKMNARNPAAIQHKPEASSNLSLSFEGVELRGRKNGTPFFTIEAEKVEVSKDNRYVNFLKGKTKPHGEFYNLKDWEEDPTGSEPKRRAITWEANSAKFDTTEQNLDMKGQVRIKTDLEDTIQTDDMLWKKADETLSSNTRTRIHTHHDTYIGANKLKVETKKKALYLEGKVYIDIKIGEEPLIDAENVGKR